MNQNLCKTALTAIVVAQMIGLSWSFVTASFEFVKFTNKGGVLQDGTPCDEQTDCDHVFRFCFDEFNGDKNDITSCKYQTERTRVYYQKNDVTFATGNPVLVLVPDQQEGLLLKIEVLDSDSPDEQKVDTLYHYFSTGIGVNKTVPANKTIAEPILQVINGTNGNSLTVQFSAYCARPYFPQMDKCFKYCQDRDDEYGHYTCDDEGQITCRPGWVDTHNYCLTVGDTNNVSPSTTTTNSGNNGGNNGGSNGGTNTETNTRTNGGTTSTLVSGTTPKTTIRPCLDNQCQNGGTCLNEQGCVCAAGFQGPFCTESSSNSGPQDDQVRGTNTASNILDKRTRLLGISVAIFITLIMNKR